MDIAQTESDDDERSGGCACLFVSLFDLEQGGEMKAEKIKLENEKFLPVAKRNPDQSFIVPKDSSHDKALL